MFKKIESEFTQNNAQRQLVIFINLPGVLNRKITTFIEHAKQRAIRLNLQCSALHIVNENNHLYVMDVKETSINLYHGMPASDIALHRDQEIVQKNRTTAQNFMDFINKVEGYYEHILIIGETHQTDISLSAEYWISNIRDLDKLTDCISSITSRHSASSTWLRVQICKAGSMKVKSSDKIFAVAIAPTQNISYISAPDSWSIIGKNGLAIDFFAHNHEFQSIISFLHKAVARAWNDLQIEQHFLNDPENKSIVSQSLEHFRIQRSSPKKNEYQKLFIPLSFFAPSTIIRSPVSSGLYTDSKEAATPT